MSLIPLHSKKNQLVMKNTMFIIFLLLAGGALSQAQNTILITDDQGNSKLLGQASVKQLEKKPFREWFKPTYDDYTMDKDVIRQLSGQAANFDSIALFMGTWCGDSRREVPRFYKVLNAIGFDRQKVNLVAVDRTFQNYKQSPGREEIGLNIHRVPTFIFYKDSIEVGRIVESPKISLEKDVLTISKGEGYTPHYEVVQALERLFEEYEAQDVLAMKDSLAITYKGKVKNKYELNTYGLVLFSSFQMTEARVAYEINRLIFPAEALPHTSLARFELVLGNKETALSDLEKARASVPGSTEIEELITSIKVE